MRSFNLARRWVAIGVLAAAVMTIASPGFSDSAANRMLDMAVRAERADDLKGAIRNAERALKRAESIYGPTHDEVAKVLAVLARLYRRADQPSDATAAERRIAAMRNPERKADTADRERSSKRLLSRKLTQTKPADAPGRAPAAAPPQSAAAEPQPRTVTRAPLPETSPPPIAGTAPPRPVALPAAPTARPPTAAAVPAPAPAPAPAAVPVAATLDPSRFAQMPVFFGTNRARGKDAIRAGADPLATFTTTPSIDLQLGAAMVSVPRQGREQGEIPRPRAASFWRAAEKEDPNFHFMLVSVDPLTKEMFIERVDRRLAASQGAFKDQAFVFVHGFNVSFDDAVYRTAQIAYDLEFSGAPFLFSWPTLEGAFGYIGARDRALASRAALREFLDLVSQKTKAKRIHLIAHSMGTWPLLDVLREIAAADAGKAEARFREVILVAPDMDRDNFATLAARVCPQRSGTRCAGGAADGVTFFATSNDRALLASLTLASGIDRAGLFDAKRPFVVRHIDTIDVSAADTSVFSYNHSQPLERGQLLRDIGALLADGVRPPHSRTPAYEQRTTTAGEAYWTYLQRP